MWKLWYRRPVKITCRTRVIRRPTEKRDALCPKANPGFLQ
jgi:hypothetical protein